jgi:hypothetical protein
MAIRLKEQTKETMELFDMFYLKNPGIPWHCLFTAYRYEGSGRLTIHFLASILFKTQTIKKDTQGTCCRTKNIWTIRLELTERGFDTLMDRSKKFELYLTFMFRDIDILKPVVKLPYLCEKQEMYNIDVNDMVGNSVLYFENVQLRLVNKPERKAFIIRFQDKGIY